MSDDELFIAYMRSFEESAKHTGLCLDCQDGEPCIEGDPIHTEFTRLQDAWTQKVRAEGKRP
ncbi:MULTISPECIES: hypothetical protein [Streptomyces]|uniref:Uncharacterized protein n=1 Tax=Streptomyces viridochromogenes TaxID=1938 RepID=A0A0L8K288_STRVR|nr:MULTISPECIES: hypothetical protein [Streptomyces]KOG20003.1 hypothetical protein ADK34_24165 [Streptomyces viridochromogenes]